MPHGSLLGHTFFPDSRLRFLIPALQDSHECSVAELVIVERQRNPPRRAGESHDKPLVVPRWMRKVLRTQIQPPIPYESSQDLPKLSRTLIRPKMTSEQVASDWKN